MPWLSLLVFLPLIGAAVVGLLPRGKDKPAVHAGLAFGLVTFLISLGVLANFSANTFRFQLTEEIRWIEPLGIHYRVGVDGISIWLLVLTTLLSLLAMAYSHSEKNRPRLLIALLLVLESAMLGAFVSLDLVLFFTFFEMTLIPMFFLISIWGGPKRKEAASKFLVYTFAGSIFMLIGIMALGWQHFQVAKTFEFGIVELQEKVANGQLWANAIVAQGWVFWAFAIALLVKSPSFPVHTWVADTYGESPIIGPILSSVMVKLGTFGFLRLCLPLFPEASVSNSAILGGLAVVSILYGGILAAAQTDIRRMIGYSTLSHMGFVILGIFSLSYTGLVGANYQQLNHGIATAMMVLLVGYLFNRYKSTEFSVFGGVKAKLPILSALFLLAMLANVGLPGTNGFVGEFMALLGSFESGMAGVGGQTVILSAAATAGVILSAVYLLRGFQRIFYGEVNPDTPKDLTDLRPQEAAPAVVLGVLVILGGLAPSVFTNPTQASVQATRLMAIQNPGTRPAWSDPNHEIVTVAGPLVGSLVRVSRDAKAAPQPIAEGEVIAPAQLHVKPSNMATTTTMVGATE